MATMGMRRGLKILLPWYRQQLCQQLAVLAGEMTRQMQSLIMILHKVNHCCDSKQ